MSKRKLITHNGTFHADDIFACATLSILLDKKKQNFKIIRTRDSKIIESGDYVFDVGGIYDTDSNKFDHHQKGGAGKRENGIEYSSFGLVWRKFGEELCGSKKAMERIDKKLVAPIDAHDNGIDLVENKNEISPYLIQDFFKAMRPTWRENNLDEDKIFNQAVLVAKEHLLRIIKRAQDFFLAEDIVISVYNNSKDKRIIILDKDYPSREIVGSFPEPLFVIHPRETDNTWGVGTVRKDIRSFENRKNLPQAWAGLKDEELQKVTGVSDAIFCHRALFLAVAKSKEGAIKLAELALQA